MAAFVGYIVGANKIAFPWDIAGGPLASTGPFADVTGASISFSDIANAGAPMDRAPPRHPPHNPSHAAAFTAIPWAVFFPCLRRVGRPPVRRQVPDPRYDLHPGGEHFTM